MLKILLIAVALSAGNEEFERAATQGAAEITVARLKAEAVAGPSVTGLLARAMTEDPARFATREAAAREGRQVYAKAVGDRLARSVDTALARLAGTRAPEEAFGTNFVRSARILSEDQVGKLLDGPYTNVFACERQTACEAQAKSLVASVRPPMSVVDSDDEAAVRKTLADNISRADGRTVFEENLDYVSQKLVEPLLADAKREKQRQQKYVRSVRADRYAPSALRADIAWKLSENVRERATKVENAALRWEIFPSVTNRTLDSAVESRVLSRLAAKIESAPLGYDAQSIAAAYAAEPMAHRRAAESLAALHTAVGAKLLASARESALTDAPEGERDELAAYLASRLASPAVSKPVGERLTHDLDPLVARVRADSSTREFETGWTTLADRSWCPESAFADAVVARSDFSAAVKNWRSLPELKELDRSGTFEETDARVDRAVREAFELARAAVAGQVKSVDEVKSSVLQLSREKKEGLFSKTPDLKTIVEMLTKATEARWTERKNAVLWPDGDLPKNAAEQHAALFPSVKRQIELVAKEILEEMEKPEEKPETPPEKPETPPEETPPEETPPEEPKLLYSIIVTRKGDRVSVKLEQDGSSVISREADAKLAPFNSAMKEVADKLGAEILKLK